MKLKEYEKVAKAAITEAVQLAKDHLRRKGVAKAGQEIVVKITIKKILPSKLDQLRSHRIMNQIVLSNLAITKRVTNLLAKSGIKTIGQLRKETRTGIYLIPGIGNGTIEDLYRTLKRLGITPRWNP